MQIIDPADPRLWTVASPVDSIPDQVLPILEDVRAAMRKAYLAVALSAPQVGVSLRFFITTGRLLPSVVVNPVILSKSLELQPGREGCLSFPGLWADVRRPYWIEVSFLNIKGDLKMTRLTGHAARIFHHEFDHLDGKCIFDRPKEAVAK